jgi:hypothetical protein
MVKESAIEQHVANGANLVRIFGVLPAKNNQNCACGTSPY